MNEISRVYAKIGRGEIKNISLGRWEELIKYYPRDMAILIKRIIKQDYECTVCKDKVKENENLTEVETKYGLKKMCPSCNKFWIEQVKNRQ